MKHQSLTGSIALIIAMTLSSFACAPQNSKSVITPTSFQGSVAKKEKVTTRPEVEEEKLDTTGMSAEEAARLELENQKDKLDRLQQTLTLKESQKNEMETSLINVETELATVVVPVKNNAEAAFYIYQGDYARAYAITAAQDSAIAAALKKQSQLQNLLDLRKVDLANLLDEVKDLKDKVEDLVKDIAEKAAKIVPAAD